MTTEKKSFLRRFLGEPLVIGTIGVTLAATVAVGTYYDDYMELYEEANDPDKVVESQDPGNLVFSKIGEGLFTLTGGVGVGDCERIVPEFEQDMTVILESPGGSLADGSCIASHFKQRNVTTVVRDTPVFDDLGKEVYTPGLVAGENFDGRTICASSCSIMFLGGDKRYLKGDVYYGIHGPATPRGAGPGRDVATVEAQTLLVAAGIIDLLTHLGVEDLRLKLLFIRVPNATMYWLKPTDFKALPSLRTLATHYVDFHGYTWTDQEANTI